MKRGSRQLRKGRISRPGVQYFITTFKADQSGRLDNEADFRIIESTFSSLEKEGIWRWRVFVIMPDHIHMVVRIGNLLSLSSAMQKFKSVTAIEINRRRGTGGAVWYRGFYDRLIRTTEEIEPYVRYIVMNPVKRGLVKKAGDWQFTRLKD